MQELLKPLKQLPYVQAVYLFGSQAKGTARPYSDTDICVFTEKITDRQRMQILRLNDKNLDVVLFHDLPLSMQGAVFREGKPLFVRRHAVLRDIKYKTIKKYLDFQWIINRHVHHALAI